VSLRKTLGNPIVWWLGATYFLLILPLYGSRSGCRSSSRQPASFTNFESG